MNAFFVILGINVGFLGALLMVTSTEGVTIVREAPDGRMHVTIGEKKYWLVDDQ